MHVFFYNICIKFLIVSFLHLFVIYKCKRLINQKLILFLFYFLEYNFNEIFVIKMTQHNSDNFQSDA